MMTKPNNVEEYIASFAPEVQILLQDIRATIKKAAPQALEVIGYGMPGYKLHGMLVYFAAYHRHIGFYPGASPILSFKEKLTPYKVSKGTVQFPLDVPLPLNLVTEIVEFRVAENLKKAETKKKK